MSVLLMQASDSKAIGEATYGYSKKRHNMSNVVEATLHNPIDHFQADLGSYYIGIWSGASLTSK